MDEAANGLGQYALDDERASVITGNIDDLDVDGITKAWEEYKNR